MMNFGLVLFGMLLAAPKAVVGTTYLVGLAENDNGSYPFETFKSTSEVSAMTVKSEMEGFGIIVVEGTPEAAKALENLSYVRYVEEDGVMEAFEGEDMGMGMGMGMMEGEDMEMGMMEGEDMGI